MTKLDQILDPRANNFSLVRLAAALSVLISHGPLLRSGDSSAEMLAELTYYNLGQHAVNVFFVLSGIMVSASLARSASLPDFLAARALRIFPALIVCALAVAFVIGPIATTLPLQTYFTDKSMLGFIVRTISVSTGAATLPGVFGSNPNPGVVVEPVWTLKYEIACYLLLAAIACSRRLNTTAGFVLLIAASWIAAIALLLAHSNQPAGPAEHLARFWLCFSFGIVLYRLRHRVPVSIGIVAALGIAWAIAWRGPLEAIVSPLATGYGAVWAAALPLGRIRQLTNEIDLSYGIYLFAYPTEQTLLWAWPAISLPGLEALAIGIAIGIATLSWFLIEKPALRSRRALLSRVRNWRLAPAGMRHQP